MCVLGVYKIIVNASQVNNSYSVRLGSIIFKFFRSSGAQLVKQAFVSSGAQLVK